MNKISIPGSASAAGAAAASAAFFAFAILSNVGSSFTEIRQILKQNQFHVNSCTHLQATTNTKRKYAQLRTVPAQLLFINTSSVGEIQIHKHRQPAAKFSRTNLCGALKSFTAHLVFAIYCNEFSTNIVLYLKYRQGVICPSISALPSHTAQHSPLQPRPKSTKRPDANTQNLLKSHRILHTSAKFYH